MDPSALAPEPRRHKFWFPAIKLGLFFVIFSMGMALFLNAFDPHIQRDPQEWKNKPKVSKKLDFLIRLLNTKGKTHEK